MAVSISPAEARTLNAKNSPLLALPGEIRNKMHRYVLTEENIVVRTDPDLTTVHATTHLLRTSSQIRNEATEIFYAENAFRILVEIGPHSQIDNAVQSFMSYAGPSNLQNITSVRIQFHISDYLWHILYVSISRRVEGRCMDCAWVATVEELKLQVPEKRFNYYMADVYLEIQQQVRGLANLFLQAGFQPSRVICVDLDEVTEGLSFVEAVVEGIEVNFFKVAAKEAFENAIMSHLLRD